jgi:ABC-2 type transport system ATP-binding protein
MLGLVERTGREFGIAVMVTSHLLGEVERVCETLLAIDAGKLHYCGPVSAFTAQTRRLSVELDDDSAPFAARLRAAGLTVETHGVELRIAMADDAVFDIIRDVAADMGVPLARMELARHRLEELFRDTASGPREVANV